MNLKLITLMLSAAISLSSCSMQTAAPEVTIQESPSPAATTQAPATPKPKPTGSPAAVSLDDIPAYSGTAYVTLNNNMPNFTVYELTTEPFERYSPLDRFGRCGVSYANICKDIMPTEERGEIGQIKPSGWHTVKYDFVDGKYLYNRCHLIAHQLAGEDANEKNLITGTRYLNKQGMYDFENKVADYVTYTGNHVLYRVTPIYDGDNLLAQGVQMEAKSVEDGGAGISFNVFCYNVQPGVTIDYATGDNWSDGTMEAQSQPTEPPAAAETSGITYILNTNTKKFHYPSCSSVSDMKEKNKREFTGTRDEAIAYGYSPCGRCHP